MQRVTGVDLSRTTFQNDMKKLPPRIKAEAASRIAKLIVCPIPDAWRFHRLNGYKPNIYTIDVWPQKAYKASFNIINGIAVMRRVGTHKAINRNA